MKITLLNCQNLRRPNNNEGLLVTALEARGHDVESLSWDQIGPDHKTDVAVLRLIWDYVERYEEFQNWLNKMKEASFPLLNKPETIFWNLRKDYLLNLSKQGIQIPTSYVWEGKYLPHWDELEKTLGPAPYVFKPIVSSGGRGTFLVQGDVSYSAAIARMNRAPFIAQVFLREVRGGELSAMVFNGKYSHAVKKVPQSGDFRVQTTYGGHVESATLDKKQIAWAENLVALAPGKPLVARVDFVMTNGKPVLMELEVFEPELFFDKDPKAADRFALSLEEYLKAFIDPN